MAVDADLGVVVVFSVAFRAVHLFAPLGGSWRSRESVRFAGRLVIVGRRPFLMSWPFCDV